MDASVGALLEQLLLREQRNSGGAMSSSELARRVAELPEFAEIRKVKGCIRDSPRDDHGGMGQFAGDGGVVLWSAEDDDGVEHGQDLWAANDDDSASGASFGGGTFDCGPFTSLPQLSELSVIALRLADTQSIPFDLGTSFSELERYSAEDILCSEHWSAVLHSVSGLALTQQSTNDDELSGRAVEMLRRLFNEGSPLQSAEVYLAVLGQLTDAYRGLGPRSGPILAIERKGYVDFGCEALLPWLRLTRLFHEMRLVMPEQVLLHRQLPDEVADNVVFATTCALLRFDARVPNSAASTIDCAGKPMRRRCSGVGGVEDVASSPCEGHCSLDLWSLTCAFDPRAEWWARWLHTTRPDTRCQILRFANDCGFVAELLGVVLSKCPCSVSDVTTTTSGDFSSDPPGRIRSALSPARWTRTCPCLLLADSNFTSAVLNSKRSISSTGANDLMESQPVRTAEAITLATLTCSVQMLGEILMLSEGREYLGHAYYLLSKGSGENSPADRAASRLPKFSPSVQLKRDGNEDRVGMKQHNTAFLVTENVEGTNRALRTICVSRSHPSLLSWIGPWIPRPEASKACPRTEVRAKSFLPGCQNLATAEESGVERAINALAGWMVHWPAHAVCSVKFPSETRSGDDSAKVQRSGCTLSADCAKILSNVILTHANGEGTAPRPQLSVILRPLALVSSASNSSELLAQPFVSQVSVFVRIEALKEWGSPVSNYAEVRKSLRVHGESEPGDNRPHGFNFGSARELSTVCTFASHLLSLHQQTHRFSEGAALDSVVGTRPGLGDKDVPTHLSGLMESSWMRALRPLLGEGGATGCRASLLRASLECGLLDALARCVVRSFRQKSTPQVGNDRRGGGRPSWLPPQPDTVWRISATKNTDTTNECSLATAALDLLCCLLGSGMGLRALAELDERHTLSDLSAPDALDSVTSDGGRHRHSSGESVRRILFRACVDHLAEEMRATAGLSSSSPFVTRASRRMANLLCTPRGCDAILAQSRSDDSPDGAISLLCAALRPLVSLVCRTNDENTDPDVLLSLYDEPACWPNELSCAVSTADMCFASPYLGPEIMRLCVVGCEGGEDNVVRDARLLMLLGHDIDSEEALVIALRMLSAASHTTRGRALATTHANALGFHLTETLPEGVKTAAGEMWRSLRYHIEGNDFLRGRAVGMAPSHVPLRSEHTVGSDLSHQAIACEGDGDGDGDETLSEEIQGFIADVRLSATGAVNAPNEAALLSPATFANDVAIVVEMLVEAELQDIAGALHQSGTPVAAIVVPWVLQRFVGYLPLRCVGAYLEACEQLRVAVSTISAKSNERRNRVWCEACVMTTILRQIREHVVGEVARGVGHALLLDLLCGHVLASCLGTFTAEELLRGAHGIWNRHKDLICIWQVPFPA